MQNGDPIVLDVAERRIDADLPAEKWARRVPSAATVGGYAAPRRGWERLYIDHVQGADTGADLEFLVGSTGPTVGPASH